MISAFGIEHGQVSKGLPRYLRDISPVVGASPARSFRGGEPLARSDYGYLRIRAHQSGKEASRLHSKWNKEKPTSITGIGQSEERWKATRIAGTKGKLAREGSRKAVSDNTPIVRPKKLRRRA